MNYALSSSDTSVVAYSALPTPVEVTSGNWQFTVPKVTPNTYEFYITVTNENGLTAYSSKVTATVAWDCLVDQISLVSTLPSSAEISADPLKANFVIFEGFPVLVLNYMVESGGLNTVELKSRFTNTASAYCTIDTIQISKVIEAGSGTEVPYVGLF
jgi:hypothetical protein